MLTKFYSFNSTMGKLILYFNEDGIIAISFSKEKDNCNYIKKYYGEIMGVSREDYNYHHEVVEYLEGNLKKFTVPFSLKGTIFQQKVWKELLNIPYGETKTYKDLAEDIGCSKGYRAVGGALNKNPIPIIVPCHRVIGSSGKLVGFAGGLDIKDRLLMLERNNIFKM